MQNDAKILVLFKDSEDEKWCAGLLKGIPRQVRVVVSDHLPVNLETLKRGGLDPAVVVVSGRLYPEARPDVVRWVRAVFGHAEILLISTSGESFPALHLLSEDGVRHLAVHPEEMGDSRSVDQFRRAVAVLSERRPWTIADHIGAGTPVTEIEIESSAQKEEAIDALVSALPGESEELEILRQKAALLADELLENALYGAPQEKGAKLFNKGDERTLLPGERIVFRFAFDGERLALEVTDEWGSLSPETLLNYLASGGSPTSPDAGGRGLFIIWRFLDHFRVCIKPGRRTVMGGELMARSPLDPDDPRGFHISTFR